MVCAVPVFEATSVWVDLNCGTEPNVSTSRYSNCILSYQRSNETSQHYSKVLRWDACFSTSCRAYESRQLSGACLAATLAHADEVCLGGDRRTLFVGIHSPSSCDSALQGPGWQPCSAKTIRQEQSGAHNCQLPRSPYDSQLSMCRLHAFACKPCCSLQLWCSNPDRCFQNL